MQRKYNLNCFAHLAGAANVSTQGNCILTMNETNFKGQKKVIKIVLGYMNF